MKNGLSGLAKERNLLASERTMLAYIRTGLACWGLGFLVIKFLEGQLRFLLGGLSVFAGLIFIWVGGRRFLQYQRR